MTIEVMKQALAVLKDHVERFDSEQFTSICELDPAKDAIVGLEQAIAEAEKQEPYAWEFAGTIFHDRKEVFDWYERDDISDIPPLALYTSPPQRQPLTDEQILEILCIHLNEDDDIEDWRYEINEARAIEAAHGIKVEA